MVVGVVDIDVGSDRVLVGEEVILRTVRGNGLEGV